ncbi:MAG: glycerol-3-phosphate dehydrogenase/oxidase [Verrucomicrobia bacterium]|nr:MAG: glycerol-3-phosphate dehydrogenase/oxidase [Verrucomicrobiota bacterium]
MQRDLKRLADETFDLLIIGGGINGLATAWDASLRGLKVALIEKSDFGGQTSSATLKIIHGGLRYLQHLDFRRMRESIRERSALLRLAPHLASPMPFLVPTYGHLMQGMEVMAAAMLMNDLISCDRNRDQPDPDRRLPSGHYLSRRATLDLAPGISEKGLTGGVIFYDGQMYNSERLTFSFALSASAAGAQLANYVAAIRLLRKGAHVTGARCRDLETGAEFDVRATITANMSGPWSDIVLGLLERPDPPRRVVRSKGIQIVAPQLYDKVAVAVPSAYVDPDAVLARGTRNFFITPWRGTSLIGTTDTVYEGDPDAFRITDRDIRDFVAEINQSLPCAKLTREQVPFAFGGLRPITEKNIDTGSTVARKYEIYDHEQDLKIGGLLSVIGVKYTTARFLAEQVVDATFQKLGKTSPRCVTLERPLAGGKTGVWADFERATLAAAPAGISGTTMRHLAHSYGTDYQLVLDLAAREAGAAALVPGAEEVIVAEILHAIRNESARKLEDVVLRRTDLGTQGQPSAAALAACADLMARELGWDTARRAREIAETAARFQFVD